MCNVFHFRILANFWLIVKVEVDRGQEPGRIRAGDRRKAGGGGAGCGRRMRDTKFFNDF